MIKLNKIIIRPIERSVLPIIHKWYNDDEVMLWGSGARPDMMYSLDYLEEVWYNEICSDSSTKMMVETNEGQSIGIIGYRNFNIQERRCRLSIIIGEKEFWGKGFGTDAIKAFIGFLFNRWNVNRVEVDTWDGNERALKCYEKCGFKVEGRLSEARFVNGKYRDEIMLGILRKEFQQN